MSQVASNRDRIAAAGKSAASAPLRLGAQLCSAAAAAAAAHNCKLMAPAAARWLPWPPEELARAPLAALEGPAAVGISRTGNLGGATLNLINSLPASQPASQPLLLRPPWTAHSIQLFIIHRLWSAWQRLSATEPRQVHKRTVRL